MEGELKFKWNIFVQVKGECISHLIVTVKASLCGFNRLGAKVAPSHFPPV